ncbi:hypothetical protein [Labilibaculum filiforme]|nr:hypothetical protein [Labilibaculum filiforme]
MKEINDLELKMINGGNNHEYFMSLGEDMGRSIRNGLDLCLAYAACFL